MESDESNGDVDEALLEGLFYNEMLFLEDPPLPAEENYELPVTTPDRAAAALTSPEVAPFPSVPQEASVVVNGGFSSASTCSVPAMMQHPWSDPSAGAASAAAPPAVPIEVQEAPPVSRVSQERAQQLVSQFATLAERLGISLPESVLQSLTDSAARNEAQTTVVTTTDAASLPQTVPSSTATAPESTIAASLPAASLPKKHSQLEIMAEAAIAAVSEPRKREAPPTKQPLYSKRRKKAQLSDCEAKLAALKQENEMLKRHLATVTNKAQVFDQERAQATFQMKRMLDEGASPEKLDPVLHKFSEMYSDYGRHRHDELTFHLSQLEKYVMTCTCSFHLFKSSLLYSNCLLLIVVTDWQHPQPLRKWDCGPWGKMKASTPILNAIPLLEFSAKNWALPLSKDARFWINDNKSETCVTISNNVSSCWEN